MTKNVKFVLNRRAFRDQVLRGGVAGLIESALEGAAPGSASVETDDIGDRFRSRAYGSSAEEAATGSLSRILGRVQL